MKTKVRYFYKVFRPIYAPTMAKIRALARGNYNAMFVFKLLRRSHSNVFRHYVADFAFPAPPAPPAAPLQQAEVQRENKPTHRIRCLYVHELGPKNPGKIIMLMNNKSGHGGFCALWIYYLNRLAFSDKMGFYHVMNWTQSDYYKEDHPIRGTRNVFEYYFQQPCDISLKSAWKSSAVIFDWNCDDYGFFDAFRVGGSDDYTFKDEDINQFAALQKKYMRLQPQVERKITRQKERLLGGHKVLAVHARGTDYKLEYKGHPIPISPHDYLETACMEAEKIGADRIFLATDDLGILKIFQDELGERLLYYQDVIRSEGSVWNCYAETNARNPHYRLGYEILRDVYTMASCAGFVCGMSYVGFMVQVVKRSQDVDFETFVRLFHGLRKNGLDLTSDEARARVRERWAKELENKHKQEEVEIQDYSEDTALPSEQSACNDSEGKTLQLEEE